MTRTEFRTGVAYEQMAASAVGVRRFANDEIARVAGQFDAEGSTKFDFLCECGSLACNALVSLTLAEYGNRASGSVVAHA